MIDMNADDAALAVGSNIRAEMGRQRVSMVELSRRTGVARSTLSYQVNQPYIKVSVLVAIAQALGVEVSDLLPPTRVDVGA